jgi:hypothetical protein
MYICTEQNVIRLFVMENTSAVWVKYTSLVACFYCRLLISIGTCLQQVGFSRRFKGTVARDLLASVFFMNLLYMRS